MTKIWSYCVSMMLAATLAAFSGVTLAGSTGPTSAASGTIVALGQDEAKQASDQDPNTPPDCKKYPKDSRCKK